MRLSAFTETAPRALAIVGPTAVGKSAIAHRVARQLGGEIVVADPFQRYRGLEIAADSPRPSELDEVRYHLVGDLALHESGTAGEYSRLAHAAIDDILDRGRVPVVTGGTGLYVRAALADLDFPPDPGPAIRQRAERSVDEDLSQAVEELRALLGPAADRIDLDNPRRVARALALALAGITPKPADELWTSSTRIATLLVGLFRDRSVIDQLIAKRIDREIADGLVQEIEAAIDAPDGLSREAAQIIGVKEVVAMRSGELDRADLPARLATRTRRLARAQLTWLRKTPGVHAVDAAAGTEHVAAAIIALWNQGAQTTGGAAGPLGGPARTPGSLP